MKDSKDSENIECFDEIENIKSDEAESGVKCENDVVKGKITDITSDEDEKFKNCVYYRGMSIEEFLRENKNYRDAVYVEHFYSKDYLNKLLQQGMILMRKGQYRF